MATQSVRRLFPALIVAVFALGCNDDAESNECGSTEIEEGTDGVTSQDPKSKEIVDACGAFCDKLIQNSLCYDSAAACPLLRDDCVDDCRLQSCDVCPGKLAPLVRCLTDNLDPATFSCTGAGLGCEAPACEEEQGVLGHCGG
ncbi:MAG: hypothetical protein HOV80_36925 [Polyangiaceae bacterium]|nr:hypothetical protein [Polyangiaceae bacterium]